ncbi:MAG: heme lyase CcmF/NrfE family subunit [Bradymonadales bacterium]|nr:MAG: heme lyase CcmF/NrfE family subunit [Bradymonadales bacterium]
MFSENFWPAVGEFCVSVAFGAILFAILFSVLSIKSRDELKLILAKRAAYLSFFLLTAATLILVWSFLTDNFLIRYVYAYSNREMPIIYKFTALWGGQDGSLLFWLWINALYMAGVLFFHRHSDRRLMPYLIICFGLILIFFCSLILYSDNPFAVFPEAPNDGRGLNPLLQNPSMAIHPPSLYLGFVGMSVPFAFAMAALMSGELGIRWIVASRIWTLVAWFFLSIGNILGAQWAYEELGWGGFWGWDPVENAALLPWLTATAFLHSVMIQEKRGMLKLWNMNLIVLSFALTILATYLTRSGVVQSVHSFASSDLGYFFLSFLIIVLMSSFSLIWYRRHQLRSENIFESFLSKESAFVVNNIALVGSAFVILWATLFPSVSELITGTRIIVGPPFFNQMLAPFGIVLLILTGVGPVIAWRKASEKNLKESFVFPVILGCLASVTLLLFGLTDWYVVLTAFGAAFVMTTIGMEFYKGGRARVVAHGESWAEALFRACFRNHRKYGGYIVHLGIVAMFVGIAGASYKRVYEFDVTPGQRHQFENYEIHYHGLQFRDQPNQYEHHAVIDLYVNGQFRRTMKPARFFYKIQEQPSTEVDIYSRLKEDVYFILGSFAPVVGEAKIRVLLQPYIIWLWLGGAILVIGGLITLMPSLGFQLRPKEIKRLKKNE